MMCEERGKNLFFIYFYLRKRWNKTFYRGAGRNAL